MDTSDLFYANNNHSVDDPLLNLYTFSEFVSTMPFVSKDTEEHKKLLFQMRVMKSELIESATVLRKRENAHQFPMEKVLKSGLL